MALSQTLPDPPKFSSRSASRLDGGSDGDDRHDNEVWKSTVRLAPPYDTPSTRIIAHSRESSLEKLQSSSLADIPESPHSASSSSSSSQALRTAVSRLPAGVVLERFVDPKAAAYGHHRQTSIVHGIQHSRNGSGASSTSSPLSPQMIAAAGAGLVSERQDMHLMNRLDSELTMASRPPTSLSGSTANASVPSLERTPSTTDSSNHTLTQRRLERMHSRARRDHAHHPSHSSRHHRDDQETVGEYVLHVLFTSFIAQAEEKLNECITVPFDPEPQIEQICGPGADPAFDHYILALGHIARQKPKPLIDSIMLWRKHKSEFASEARSQLQQLRVNAPGSALVRRNTEPVQTIAGNATGENGAVNGPSMLAAKQEYAAQSERRSIVSIYILCRVLLEVITQSNLNSIAPEMEDKLEGIIFLQLKIADIDQLCMSPLKLANWHLFTQLLGAMSEINFTGVTERFLNDIERSLQDLTVRSPTSNSRERDPEGQLELVLGGMKHLRIRIDTDESWDQACDFLASLGRLFARSHGQKVKSAFCEILDTLLLPIAAKATNRHFANPKWAEVVSNISPRLGSMFAKPRHWLAAFPLTATMLCVSPPENSSNQWLQLVRALQPRLKDSRVRHLCLQAISRLLWTYLYRTNDTASNMTRKLDEVMQLVLPPAKRPLSEADTASTGPLIQIIRIIGFRNFEYCCKNIIFPLINAELFNSNKELKVEQLEPDRMVIGIRAFLTIIFDLEKGQLGRPPFPQQYPAPATYERVPPDSPASTSSQSQPPSSPLVPIRDESLSRPVHLASLTDSAREHYKKFSEILGKITIICDNTFGGQAALDEKFNSPGPKTPITETFNFARRDDHHQSPADQKQAFYELLHVAVQALPRCLSSDIPFNPLINLLCTGTAHIQSNIAESSAQSLKSIARQSHAHQVNMGFARFIFNFDDRYSTMSDGGMLGPGHIENTLRLYAELLQIWRDEIRQKTKYAASDSPDLNGPDRRGMKLDLSSIWAEVEHVEARGLFFLCSQSRRVRYFAITVLRLITEFDTALAKDGASEKDNLRLIDILENDSVQVMSFKDEHLSVAERSRLQRGMQNSNNKGALIELCTSDVSYDTTLWFKIFPNLIRIAYDRCPFTVTIARDLVCNRILQMYKTITILSEPTRGLVYYGSDPNSARLTGRTPTTQPDVLIEQWKLYLAFACTTLADPGNPLTGAVPGSQHLRKGSKSTEQIVSARILFKYLIPLLLSTSGLVREAVVLAMGSINVNIYRTLLEELQTQVARCNDDARARIHQRTNSGPRRNRKMDLLRTEITHVYKLTSHFLKTPEVCQDDWILSNLCAYTKDIKLFLMDGEVQMDWEFQKLRRHYCGLMEELFEGINRTKDPSRWMTFESRKSSFALMEDWCGFSPNQPQIRQREDTIRQSLIDQQSHSDRGIVTAAMEIEKRNLKTAALSAMAALCAGPVSVTTESGVVLQFDIRRMLAWIEGIFSTGSDRVNVIGRRALKNLIVYNQEYPYLLEHCIARCYLAEAGKVLESYFAVICEVLLEHADYPSPFWKLLALCLFTLGNDQSEIRSKSSQVLRALEERQQATRITKIRDFDISISDKTKAVYKLAQFEISKRLAKQHPELAFHIFSEFTLYFKSLEPGSQRNTVAVILPWIQTIELKVDPNGGPIAQSYVLLANLLEITIKSSAALHNEVQALWQAIATGPHPGNVRLVLDFIISLCLERREQNFVEYAKQIVVFLSSTPSTPGIKVVEFLLMQISPKAMVPNEKREAVPPPPDISQLPYCADLSEALPVGTKQAGFSLGQLSLILLVDLMVSPVHLNAEHLPVLLQVVTVLWDHYTPLVQEQAREMLVHLIHELVISKMDDATPMETKASIEDVIDAIRRHDRAVVWSYEDSNGKVDDRDNKVPQSMEYLTAEVVKTFEVTFPGIKEQWSRLSLTWATSCPVRHLACRSFQIFRCILTSMDQLMLGDMLARLSNTIADEDTEIQTFSMEILTTLKTLIFKLDSEKLLSFPQLFWTMCACLESINELEFLEAVEMLNEYLEKLDIYSPTVRRVLMDGQPQRWDGVFEGLQPLLYKGLRSSTCLQPTLDILDKLVQLPSDPLIGDDNRLLFTILANFARFSEAVEQRHIDEGTLHTADILFAVAEAQGFGPICDALGAFMDSQYQSSGELMFQLFGGLREFYLPQLDFQMLTMLMSFLTNSMSTVKTMTMRLLRLVIKEIDMRKPEIAGHGSDLISPLLRLLQTKFRMEALEVLDSIMPMVGSTSSTVDKQHLRMSMTRSSSRAIRKEYERTESLFGIPEESGWAVPVPAKKTDSTRANIHAAFYMCQENTEDGIATDPTPTPEVEFHADDYRYGYFEMPDRTETMMSDEARGDGHMGDLVTKLDSLDDFFDNMSQTSPSEGRSSRTVTEFTPESYESGARLYDDVLPILSQASSNTSFQNGFVDKPPAPREGTANTMNPAAFNPNPISTRPGLHFRSITSPSAPASYSPHLAEFTSDEELTEDLFSDGDDDPRSAGAASFSGGSMPGGPGTLTGAPSGPENGSFFLENMIKPIAQTTRTRMRRLTGGRSRDAERQREILRAGTLGPSPQVPKVPNSFLQQQHQQQSQPQQQHYGSKQSSPSGRL
ncbi:cell morphogenesis N-terminal-domain-containing protein [Xylariomycetidae sp. FL2044]|nr:cell morphogenesis N-terminal-domain-containing protein [Xylariomycetidae sp. FL2044]